MRKILCDEIHAAIHSMLSGQFSDKLYWTSVGLLDSGNKIEWKSFVNSDFKLGPCSVNCKTNHSPPPPPCAEDSSQWCKFRVDLASLENVTMTENSNSMGELSLAYFTKMKRQHPYISLDAMAQYSWLMSKGDVMANLKRASGSQEEEEYKVNAGKCMPDHTTSALVPLVQSHGGKFGYIGAVVLCANKESTIWGHLPRIKAVALSLAEAHRHKFVMWSDATQNNIIILLRELFTHEFGVHLYCKEKHSSQKADDFLIAKTIFDNIFSSEKWGNENLPKGLYKYISTGIMPTTSGNDWRRVKKASESEDVNLPFLLNFLDKNFNFKCKLLQAPNSDSNTQSCLETSHTLPMWPTQPGLIALISLIRIYTALNATDSDDPDDPDDSVERVKDTYVRVLCEDYNTEYESTKVVWTFVLARNAANLEKSVWSRLRGLGGGGHTTTTIIESLFGDLHTYKNDLISFKEHKLFEQILGNSEAPIFNIWFGKNNDDSTLNISWECN